MLTLKLKKLNKAYRNLDLLGNVSKIVNKEQIMYFKTSLEIDFYSERDGYESQVSVFIDNSEKKGRSEKIGEIWLLTHFCIRTMVNFGTHDSSPAWFISDFLDKCASVGVLKQTENITLGYLEKLKIVSHKSKTGEKGFSALLNCSNQVYFNYNTRGFGFLGKDLDKYCLASIESLMKYLAEKRKTDKEYIKGLELVAKGCSNVFTRGISIKNQGEVSMLVATSSYSME